MKVKVLFFGATATEVGLRETSIDLDGISNVGAVVDLVMQDHQGLENRKLLFSVNQEYAGLETLINDGDELAIFTPVSGG